MVGKLYSDKDILGQIRSRGFTNKVEALAQCINCGIDHKSDIDYMITEGDSEDVILRKMAERYQGCFEAGYFPSQPALNHYKKKILSRMQSEKEEIIVRKEIIKKVQDMFSPMFEGIRMYNRLEHRIQRAMKVEEKMGGVPFKPLNKLTDQQIRLHKEICDLSAVLM